MAYPPKTWYLYVIRCNDNSLYTGITLDLERRFSEHQEQGKKCAKYLRGKTPLELVFTVPAGKNKSEASRLEYRVKQLSKSNKERLVAGAVSLTQLQLVASEIDLEKSQIVSQHTKTD